MFGAYRVASDDDILVPYLDYSTTTFLDTLGAALQEIIAGRTTPQGLFALHAMLRQMTPQTIVISLGTNDGPSPARFRDRIERVLSAAPPGACIVWTTVIRAPRKGRYHGLNAALREEARVHSRLVLVDWARAVASGRVALPDGVHPDPAGFYYRSQMIAGGVARGC